MDIPANHLAGEQTGKQNYERREDHQEGDGQRTREPRSQAGGEEEE